MKPTAPTVATQAQVTTIFQQPWWIDAVSGSEGWHEVRAELKGGQSAMLRYILKKSYGFTFLRSPGMSLGGPVFSSSVTLSRKRLSLEKKLVAQLLQLLPRYDAFNMYFSPAITNWLPYYWQGFEQRTRYTYRIEDLSDLDAVYGNFMSNIKGDIKKAENRFGIEVNSTGSIDTFLDVNEMTFRRQGKKAHYSRDTIVQLDAACEQNNCRRIFFARDSAGAVHAAVYLIWDKNSAYYLMGGTDPELRNSGAMSLALWKAIQFASSVTRSFDFEGSVIEPVETYFRAFGATQVPYFQIWKFNSPVVRLGYTVKQIVDHSRLR